MRYKVHSAWSDETTTGRFTVQAADALDTRTGHVYRDGAYRVVDTETGKPAKRGKGGTVPFYGETAWNDSRRLAEDLVWAERRAALDA